ncbi:MAG: PEGA domain-containing protein [Deltaproteobacteria bacterium]|nr:PEGA domain-containing protein [Deltaproteobacteria bacterium]
MRSRHLILLACLALTFMWRPTVMAAPADGSEALIREGLSLRRNGDDEGALERFSRAAAIHRGGRVLAQIALAEQALGRWVDAEAHLVESLGLREEAWIAKNRPLLESALADISGHLGTLELISSVAGARVKVNGTERGTMPLRAPLRVPSGTVTVELEADGYFPLARGVVVLAGGKARETLNMVPVKENLPTVALLPRPQTVEPAASMLVQPADAPPAPSGRWQRRAAWTTAVAAGALLVYGGISHYQREHAVKDGTRDGCTQISTDPKCESLRADLDAYETKMAIGYAGAAALAATSGLLFWLAPESSSSNSASATLFMRGSF